MVEKSSSRQHQILELLLENKNGLSIGQLATQLDISRAAVQQHFVSLERDGFIKKKQLNKTGGRPVSLYELTTEGINYFPKQYAWLSEIILNNLADEISAEQLLAYMGKLGQQIAEKLQQKFAGKNLAERIDELAQVMNELGFQVKSENDAGTGNQSLHAFNCVYHDLAQKHPAICEFDLTLISTALNKPVTHASCMAKGDCACTFIIKQKSRKT